MKRHIDRIEDAVYERGYVYNLHFHIIWCTKYRNPWFTTPELVNEMKDILQSLAKQADVDIQEMEVMPEYIHLLCSFLAAHT
jgi:putative transposase